MDRWQKQVQASLLKSEAEALAEVKKTYEQALKDIKAEIKRLQEKPETQSVIYQTKYQQALERQVSGILDNMQKGQYSTLQSYLDGCYTDAYVGAMYDLSKQGVPVITPIEQTQVTKAVLTDSKLSKSLYATMGKYLKPLKKTVAKEISRGIASNMAYADIARNLDNRTSIGWSNAYRIARTEGHRIQQAATIDAQHAAKDSGADVVKQWDATLDGRTRKDHRKLDGQIRELDDDFEVGGHKASAPGHFGRPEEDINCRCVLLQRARWALDEDELETLKERAKFHKLDKTDDFEDYKERYLKAAKYQEMTAEASAKQKRLSGMDKTYTGIWKDPVSLADYASKKSSIGAKRSWYEEQIAAGSDKSDQYKAYLKDLEEFERLGAKYEELAEELRKLREEMKKYAPARSVRDAFTQERKDAAYWFTDAKGGTKGADKVLRDKCGEVWRDATKDERKAIYGYTEGSGAWNRPLSGFQKPYYEPGSGWEAKYSKGYGNVWLDYEGKGDEIRRMTDLIEKSQYDFDIWLQRGCGDSAIESFLDIPYGSLGRMTEADLQQFVGRDNRIGSFVSTSVSKGNGFGGSVIMNIYAPQGTHMMYAEPFSRFGAGGKLQWDGKAGQSYFGSESEMILQRGGSYTITKIEKKNGTIYIDMEAHPEDGYDLFQQDPDEWTGPKDKFR